MVNMGVAIAIRIQTFHIRKTKHNSLLIHNIQNIYRVYPNSTDKLSGQILRLKISIKLLKLMGLKTHSLRDNQQKPKNNYDLNSLDFMGLSVY
jgi:hypothetical protein